MRGRTPLVIGALVAAALSTATLAAVDVIDAPASSSQAAVRLTPPRSAIVFGDSALAALDWAGAEGGVTGFRHTLDLESCRRLYRTSCPGRGGRPPLTVYDALGAYGPGFDDLVVAVGYNDFSNEMADSFRRVVERSRSLGYTRIVWWTLRVGSHQSFANSNAAVRNLLATGQYPDVVLADWNAYSAGRPGWFVSDGVHYRSIGAWAAADYLSRKMAFLDGRGCPIGVQPDVAPQEPCPDPDATGPIADIGALYPVR